MGKDIKVLEHISETAMDTLNKIKKISRAEQVLIEVKEKDITEEEKWAYGVWQVVRWLIDDEDFLEGMSKKADKILSENRGWF